MVIEHNIMKSKNHAMFLYRHPETGYVEPKWVVYQGTLPPKVWERLAKRFLKLDASGYFWPLDGMDAYGAAVEQVEITDERIARGEIVLKSASRTTYLVNAGCQTLLHFHERQVCPTRETYRAVERKTVGKGAVGEDGFDADNYDGTEDNPDQRMTDACGEKCHESVPVGSALTAQRLVEQMIGTPWARERAERAASILEDIYLHLPERPVRAFRAYVAEDGHFPRAAKRAHIGINHYYREWPQWLALAREVGEKIEVSCH